MLFKWWKSHNQLDKHRPTKSAMRQMADLVAKLIGVIPRHRQLPASPWENTRRRLRKAAKVIRRSDRRSDRKPGRSWPPLRSPSVESLGRREPQSNVWPMSTIAANITAGSNFKPIPNFWITDLKLDRMGFVAPAPPRTCRTGPLGSPLNHGWTQSNADFTKDFPG